jgi:hypothetical protein
VKRDRCFNLWIGYISLCSIRLGRETGFDLVCGFDIAGSVVVDLEENQGFGLVCG